MTWDIYEPDETGLKMIILEDSDTGTVLSTTTSNPTVRVAAHRAWSGARQSRSSHTPWEIMKEAHNQGDADRRLAHVFHEYGHASVADMARLQVDFANVPMHFALALFNLSATNSGQEKSTRYQAMSHPMAFGLHAAGHYLPDLSPRELAIFELGCESLASKMTFLTGKYEMILGGVPEISGVFAKHYQVDWNKRDEVRALQSRVLDCTRNFQLFGKITGFTFETSARDWSRIIGELKASPLPYYRRVASQIEQILAPDGEKEKEWGFLSEAPSLIRHTEPRTQTNENLRALWEYMEMTDILAHPPYWQEKGPMLNQQSVLFMDGYYSPAELLVAQYIKLLYPGMARGLLLAWVAKQGDAEKRQISSILFRGHTHQQELPIFARTTDDTLFFRCSLAEIRDFNRHRSFGRFLPLPLVYGKPLTRSAIDQIINYGYVLPSYFDLPAFAAEKVMIIQDMRAYYDDLVAFIDRQEAQYGDTIDYSFALNLLPLAHQIEFWMHGDIKQLHYLTQLRSRPGGHINYRQLAYSASQQIARRDSYLSALALEKEPDPSSREEFFDRG